MSEPPSRLAVLCLKTVRDTVGLPEGSIKVWFAFDLGGPSAASDIFFPSELLHCCFVNVALCKFDIIRFCFHHFRLCLLHILSVQIVYSSHGEVELYPRHVVIHVVCHFVASVPPNSTLPPPPLLSVADRPPPLSGRRFSAAASRPHPRPRWTGRARSCATGAPALPCRPPAP